MSTNMTPIDEGFIQYPVPGIDNDSQGFRDRYAIIRNNLNTAREELGLLNTNTAKINSNNNFGGNKIINANLSGSTFETNISFLGGISESQDINFTEGFVHVVRCDADLSLNIKGWINNSFGFIRLILTSDGSGRTVTLDAGSGIIYDDNSSEWLTATASTRTILVESSLNPKIVEVSSFDGGTTLLLRFLGQSGSGIAGPTSLNNLSDVNLGALLSNQILSYNVSTGSFVNSSSITTATGNVIIDLNTGEIKSSSGDTLINTNTGEIKNTDGSTLIDITNGEIKRPDGTTFLDLTGGIIKSRQGNVIIDTDEDIPVFENVELDPVKLRTPRYDNAGRDDPAINLGRVGSIIYNTQTNEYQAYVGGTLGGWRILPVATSSEVFTAPSYTTAERDNLTPGAGDIIFNSTSNKHQGFDGTQWNDMY